MPSSVTTVRVRYAETDRMGVVYYANYFVWFEVARADLLRTLGWTYREMEEAGVSLPVIEAHCDYRRSARYDDEVEVRTAGTLMSPVRMEFDYEVLVKGQAEVAAIGRTVHAALDRDGRPCRLAGSDTRGLRMKALVTGAAGFIGSHLSAVLAARGFDVVGLDCFTDYYGRDLKEANLATLADDAAVPVCRGRAADRRSRRAPRRRDARLSPGRAGRRAKELGRGVLGLHVTQRRGDAAAARGREDTHVARFVYASSSSVYGDLVAIPMREEAALHPVSPYGVTKLAAEHLCHLYYVNYGVPTVSLRYFTVYGPRQRPDMAFHKFLRAALTGQPIAIYGDGEQTRDFTFVADAASATATAGDRGRPGAVYNIGGGSRVTLNSVLDRLAGITGRSLDIRREDPQKGDMRDTFADTTRALEDLDFRPTYTLDAGLTAEYEWLAASLKGSRR